MDDETIKKIIGEMFNELGKRVREPKIKRYLKKHGINNEDEMLKILIRAEDLGLLTICASPHKYGEILVVKGKIKSNDKNMMLF